MGNTSAPTVSVVVPAFNAQAFLVATLESLAKQTHSPNQIVVIDDGSTDNSAEVVLEWAKASNISLKLTTTTNSGVAAARNLGVELAESDLVAFIDADDIWEPTKLGTQLERLGYVGDMSPVVTWYYTFQTPGIRQELIKPAWNRDYMIKWARFARRGPLLTSTLLMSRRDFLRLGGFRVNLGTLADLDFAMRLFPAGRIHVVKEPLVGYRMHSSQMHRDWLRTQSDLLQLQPRDYVLLANVDMSDWQDIAKVASDWHARSNVISLHEAQRTGKQKGRQGMSLFLRYLTSRLKTEFLTLKS